MTDKYSKLFTALLRTRDDFLEVCSQLHINPNSIDPTKLKVMQCVDCSIWETKLQDDVCSICYEYWTS